MIERNDKGWAMDKPTDEALPSRDNTRNPGNYVATFLAQGSINERYSKPSAIQIRIEFLEKHRRVIKKHMATRAEDEDFHGVSDDANDLREVDAELRGLRFVARQP